MFIHRRRTLSSLLCGYLRRSFLTKYITYLPHFCQKPLPKNLKLFSQVKKLDIGEDGNTILECYRLKEIFQVFSNVEYLRCYIDEYNLSEILKILSKLANLKSVVFMLDDEVPVSRCAKNRASSIRKISFLVAYESYHHAVYSGSDDE